ncbi:MAG: ribosome recycling factor [Christensenellales bacterium]|jgi:ribosome recycling factor
MNIENEEVALLFEVFEENINKSIDTFIGDLQKMRAGRANPLLLNGIEVNYYGCMTPLNQMANITVPEARVLMVSVWDTSALKAVEKAIIDANIGIMPNNDGKVIRLIFPELTEERRKMLVKEVTSLAEKIKVSVRNERRDINAQLKKYKKDSVITEDDLFLYEKKVDSSTNDYIAKIDKIAADKEKEIMSV